MRALTLPLAAAALSAELVAAAALAAASSCPPDSVRAGTVCIDTYEASVWVVPDPTTVNRALVRKIQAGTVKLKDLAGRATQVTDVSISMFPGDGNWTPLPGSNPPTPGVYAVSVAGVIPNEIYWHQADQACALAGKRLPTSYEWQVATAGTPDPGTADDGVTTCHTGAPMTAVATGSRSACVSAWGAHDTIGNESEWVADWKDYQFAHCTTYLGNRSCFGGPASVPAPAALIRGGNFSAFSGGSFTVDQAIPIPATVTGFRCAR